MPDTSRPETAAGRPESGGLLSPTTRLNLILLCILLLLCFGIILTEFLTSIILMLAASLILTYILLGPVTCIEKIMNWLRDRYPKLSWLPLRALSILVVYLLFFTLLSVSVIRIAPPLAMQIKGFARDLPAHLSRFAEVRRQVIRPSPVPNPLNIQNSPKPPLAPTAKESRPTPENLPILRQKPSEKRQSSRLFSDTYVMTLERLAGHYQQYMSRLGGLLLDLGTLTLSGLIYILTTLVLVFYLLHDGRVLKENVMEMIPARHEEAVSRFVNRLHMQFNSVIQGQVLMSFLAGGLMYLMLLLLDIPYSLLLGVFFGLASILPVIGPWIGLLPVVTFIGFSRHPDDILQVMLGLGLFYVTKAHWLWPKLIHRKYDVHPILFILTFVACLRLVGPLGILLSFPLAGILGAFAHTLRYSHMTALGRK